MEELKPNLNEYDFAPNQEVLVPVQSPFSQQWYKLAYNPASTQSGNGNGPASFSNLDGNAYDNASLALALFNKQDKLNQLLTGFELTPGLTGTLTPGTYFLDGQVVEKQTFTTFYGLVLSDSGKFRTIAFYGLANGVIEKVESPQSVTVIPPSTNIPNKALLRYMIVSDATYANQTIIYQQTGGASSFTDLDGNAYDNASLASALAGKQDKLNQLISGCEITPGASTNLTAGSWRINNTIYPKNTPTTFTGIALSGNGLFRTVAFYGNITNGIEKVESAQSAAVVPPSNEITDKALLRWMIVGDATFQNQVVDYEKFALKADVGDKATLTTEVKTNLVAAVNEVKGTLNSQSSDQITLKIFKVSNYGTP